MSTGPFEMKKKVIYLAIFCLKRALSLVTLTSRESLTMKLTRQNLRVGNITVHCYPRMLTDDRRYSKD